MASSLLLLDIIEIRVSKECENTECEKQVTFRSIVECIGLVPIWELSQVGVSEGCMITDLEIFFTWLFDLWHVVEGVVGTRVRVWISELTEVSSTSRLRGDFVKSSHLHGGDCHHFARLIHLYLIIIENK